MTTLQTILYYLMAIHMLFVVRYVAKASFGHAPNYKFYKLLTAFLVPIAGYFIVMRESVENE